LDDPASQQTQIWNRQYDQIVLRQLLATVESHFEPTTWKAFCRVALDGEEPKRVAEELQISLNSVFLAKSRILRRLRVEEEVSTDTRCTFMREERVRKTRSWQRHFNANSTGLHRDQSVDSERKRGKCGGLCPRVKKGLTASCRKSFGCDAQDRI
jgi:hypothetical protein